MHRGITRREALFLGFGAGAGLAGSPAVWARETAPAFTGFHGTQVRFASRETSRGLLMAEDEWMAATSPFQRRAVMGSATEVTEDAFRQWNGDAAAAWPPEQVLRWLKALEVLAPAFNELGVPLPGEVWIVASDGRESAMAPYTRGQAVVLPGDATQPGYTDAMLLAHELWHVAARHAPALATRLYAELGFEPVAELDFPAAWAGRRIANPDAPSNHHAMRVRVAGKPVWVTPVLVARRTTLKPGETFFSVMDVRLLQIEPGASVSRAVMAGEEPVWHPLRGEHDYLQRLGGNTEYVVHPEETLADNVAFMSTSTRVRNPALLGRLRAVFLAQSRR